MSQPSDPAVTAELDRLRQALSAAEHRIDERGCFLSVMSHELREPMNGVVGMARLLRDTRLDDEQAGYVDAVIGSAETLITLINDILDLSRIDAGRVDLNPVDIALRPFFERLATLFRQRATAKGIAFGVDLAADLPAFARGDPGRLRQIVTNLVTNAIKFTSQGEVRLTVGAGVAAGAGRLALELRVADTGIGIPPERQADVFSPFAQADAGIARLYGGSGLGLMIAQRLAALMHGAITLVGSSASGTVFAVRVELDPPLEGARRVRASIAGTRLLIADAQGRSAKVMADLARLWGVEVRVAASMAEALTVLRESADRGAPFDFALVDRALPDRRGDDLGPLVRAAPALAGLRLVLLVAGGVRGDAARVQALGFDGYLQKPVTASTLLDALQQLHGAPDDHELLTVHSVGERRSRPLRLLVADDNPVNCRLAGIMLEKAGHSVTTVADGADALAAVTAGAFDAVLMDIQMPVMGGLEATRRIRALADPDRAGVPIIAITANAMKGDDDDCYAAGMSGYVTKPIDRGVLLETLDRLTAARPGAAD
jgi:CheY-like chemotaxis protein/nitrogen-specific signal transduction histidine kinase